MFVLLSQPVMVALQFGAYFPSDFWRPRAEVFAFTVLVANHALAVFLAHIFRERVRRTFAAICLVHQAPRAFIFSTPIGHHENFSGESGGFVWIILDQNVISTSGSSNAVAVGTEGAIARTFPHIIRNTDRESSIFFSEPQIYVVGFHSSFASGLLKTTQS